MKSPDWCFPSKSKLAADIDRPKASAGNRHSAAISLAHVARATIIGIRGAFSFNSAAPRRCDLVSRSFLSLCVPFASKIKKNFLQKAKLLVLSQLHHHRNEIETLAEARANVSRNVGKESLAEAHCFRVRKM